MPSAQMAYSKTEKLNGRQPHYECIAKDKGRLPVSVLANDLEEACEHSGEHTV